MKIFANTNFDEWDGSSRFYVNSYRGEIELKGSREFVEKHWKSALRTILGYDPFAKPDARITALIPAEFLTK